MERKKGTFSWALKDTVRKYIRNSHFQVLRVGLIKPVSAELGGLKK